MSLKMLSAVTVFAGALSTQAFADFLPKNDLAKFDNLHSFFGISQAEFNAEIANVKTAFEPIVAAHGAKLVINARWNDGTVNASASQMGSTWNVNMYGGLARRPEVTRDGFALVICHELGHHLAGYPFYEGDDMSSEGQADYFATQACGRKLWIDKAEENRLAGGAATVSQKALCDARVTEENERNLCYRTAVGSQSLANLLAKLGGDPVPDASTPDQTQVGDLDTSHPAAQCRLDTYLNGATCKVEFNFAVIPGKGLPQGNNSLEAQTEAFLYSCSAENSPLRARPKCWFKPASTSPQLALFK